MSAWNRPGLCDDEAGRKSAVRIQNTWRPVERWPRQPAPAGTRGSGAGQDEQCHTPDIGSRRASCLLRRPLVCPRAHVLSRGPPHEERRQRGARVRGKRALTSRHRGSLSLGTPNLVRRLRVTIVRTRERHRCRLGSPEDTFADTYDGGRGRQETGRSCGRAVPSRRARAEADSTVE
jgi:hypothetical protein